jgi:hypothetical protein
LRLVARYRVVTVTIALGLLGGLIAMMGIGVAVQWLFGACALAIATSHQ